MSAGALFLAHLAIAVAGFFLINWLGRHAVSSGYFQISFVATADDAPAFNTVFRIIAPLVYLTITASLLYWAGLDALVRSYWRVVPLYFACRWGFNLIMGRHLLLRWPRQVFIAVVATALAIVAYQKVLRVRQNLLPDPSNLSNELWLIILVFVYNTLNRVEWPYGASADQRRRRYIRARYGSALLEYGAIVRANAPSKLAEAIAFAVLIYESFNRPPIVQFLERSILFRLGVSKSFGPMQVRSDRPLTDAESVEMGTRKVARDLEAAVRESKREHRYMYEVAARRDQAEGIEYPSGPHVIDAELETLPLSAQLYTDAVFRTARRYNVRSDYPHEIVGVYQVLVERFYPELRHPNEVAKSAA